MFNLFRTKTSDDAPKVPVKKNSGRSDLASAPNTPLAVYETGAARFAEIYGSSMVSSNRMFVISIACVLLSGMALMVVLMLFPLKTIQSWVVEVNPANGLVSKPIEVQKIAPSIAVVKSELARWAEAVYTLDVIRTPELYKWANARARDKAIPQFSEFRVREKSYERLQKDASLFRDVKVTSVDASQSGIAFVFLTTTERQGTGEDVIKKNIRLTLHYVLDAPKTESDLLANPLGIYVVFFNESEERAN